MTFHLAYVFQVDKGNKGADDEMIQHQKILADEVRSSVFVELLLAQSDNGHVLAVGQCGCDGGDGRPVLLRGPRPAPQPAARPRLLPTRRPARQSAR
jgi:hypothetical protein